MPKKDEKGLPSNIKMLITGFALGFAFGDPDIRKLFYDIFEKHEEKKDLKKGFESVPEKK